MKRVRLSIRPNPYDCDDDLRYAARVRFDLWAHSPVEIDPDSVVHAIRRTRPHGLNNNAEPQVYFEFTTDALEEVRRVVREYGHAERVDIAVVEEGEECQNCGFMVNPVLPTVCPKCGHRDIDPCPHCSENVPRREYDKVSVGLFRCPRCGGHVRLQLNPDLLNANLTLNEPVVVVSSVGA